jgi:hypothetical protein
VAPQTDRSPLTRAIAPLAFGLLVLITVGGFAWAQHLKREPLILDRVSFGHLVTTAGGAHRVVSALTPNGDCVNDNGRIHFRITRSDTADVEIVDPQERLVRTLARDRFLKRYRFFTFHWNGRTNSGAIAPPGRYKLRLILHQDDRSLVPAGVLRLHRVPGRGKNGCNRGGGVSAGTKQR